jgi:DNA-binding response OmpR family regulator
MNEPTPSALRVLVVDDDPDLCSLLSDYLTANGFVVQTVGDGVAMRGALAREQPDAIVMDLMLPGEDGLSLTRSVKAQWDIPVLMLSARGEEMDRVIGLEVGADDYLPKPFGPRELLARLRAVLRRRHPAPAPAERLPDESPGPEARERKAFGPYQLDTAGHRLLRDGHEVVLTSAEYALLAAFVGHPGRVLSRDVLVDMLKGYDRDPFDRSVDSRVTRLRRKIEADPAAPQFIRTVRGEGYLFNPQGGSA